MYKKSIFCLVLIVLFLACSHEKTPPVQRPEHPMISAYTAGFISRASTIRIVFITDIVDSSRINSIVEPTPLALSPKIKGTTVWIDRRTLEFRPAEWLPQGVTFTADLHLKKILQSAIGEESFSFRFSSITPSLAIDVDGLSPVNKSEPARQELTGTLTLSDVARPQEVEPILSARLNGKQLPVTWQHKDRTHHFTVEEIIRGDRAATLQLRWDGKAAGIDEQGEQKLQTPPLNAFLVTQVRPVTKDQQYIEIRFSDPLLKPQPLDGLVQVENHPEPSLTLDNNIIRVYSTEPLTGDVVLSIQSGIQNTTGSRLTASSVHKVTFEETKPSVRFVGKGVILPTTQGLTIPIEAVNVSAVIVTAVRISTENVPQFLQVNDFEGDRELRRVGREVWKQVVELDNTPAAKNSRKRYGLDVSPLSANHPGGMYQLSLSFRRSQVIYDCSDAPKNDKINLDLVDWADDQEYGDWPFAGADFDWSEFYNQRFNPCHPAYYYPWWDHDVSVSQNVIISDIGLLAKRAENDTLAVFVSDLKTTEPLANVPLKVYDFQRTLIASGKSGADGSATLTCPRKPFLLTAENNQQFGYLKLNDGAALSVSHFDVAGETVRKGIKGFIYGERGVWRPGDPIFLTFILMDEGKLPRDHPVSLELINPRGQTALTQTQIRAVNGFYSFRLSTPADAPTGNWTARCSIGGVTFEKALKIETVMPNRLDARLDFGGKAELGATPTTAKLTSSWLFGAKAANLSSRVELRLAPTPTRFEAFPNFIFDDPMVTFSPESFMLFDGTLNTAGEAVFSTDIGKTITPPGKLTAVFNTRVFEPGGAFSSLRTSLPMHVYDHYLGVSAPTGDAADPTLRTDRSHPIKIVRVTSSGRAEGNGRVEVKLYKIRWRWWWEKGEESLADYIGAESYRPVQSTVVQLQNGIGQWELKVGEQEWGRYLIEVRDLQGRHSSGQIVFMDEPGWQGRGRRDAAEGAGVLSFTADKTQYNVGDKVTLTIPTAKTGRGLVSLETGSRLLKSEWFEPKAASYRYTFKVTPEMAPTVYAYVTYLQPHLQTANDLPIRLYGVIPINVVNPSTILQPVIECAETLTPEAPASITVKEAGGKTMTYTLAIVDQGLLDLTRFATPNPWEHFYSREALGVKTWDLYDWVAGAYGGKLERLLAIGGDERLELQGGWQANRFPPMVLFQGPFELKRSQSKTHVIDLPQYVGAARVMVVAGSGKAFGTAEKSVFMRKPLMVLATLPRVIGMEEEVSLPVSVFAMDPTMRQVQVKLSAEGPVTIQDAAEQTIAFKETGEQLVTFTIRANASAGLAKFHVQAVSGAETAQQTIEIAVRNPMKRVTQTAAALVQPNESWAPDLKLPGQPGTNIVTAELSRIPPLNLSRRLGFLISYPHGCVEQTTSAVFPQLYLQKLLDLPNEKKQEIEANIKAGIQRLRSFQCSDGGFGYWPGDNESDGWCTNYAGAFLLEAKTAGYTVPSGVFEQWRSFQKRAAQGWLAGNESSALIQADRLYTLAAAGEPEMAAMNRLKEQKNLVTVSRWRLAAAYQLAGQRQAAISLTAGSTSLPPYRELSGTFGSDLRDKAILLETMTLLNDQQRAFPLLQEISAVLSSEEWLSTHSTAYSLLAIARYAGVLGKDASPFTCMVSLQGHEEIKVATSQPLAQQQWAIAEDTTAAFNVTNTGTTPVYARLLMEGLPRIGGETASSNGLEITVNYMTMQKQPVDVTSLPQGTDFIAEVTVRHTGVEPVYKELALSHIVPSGWEIHNERFAGEENQSAAFEYQDIRDDRIFTYFDLNRDLSKTFRVLLNASYVGRYYLPPINVEAMYDASIYARTTGEWIQVVSPDK